MLSTAPAAVGGAIAASVAGPKASVWVRVRGAAAVAEDDSGSDEGASAGAAAGLVGSDCGSSTVEGACADDGSA